MDFSFSIWPLQWKASVAAGHYSLSIPICAISLLDEKDVHLMGQHCPVRPLKLKKLHAAEHLLHSYSVLQEFHLSR